MTNKYEFDRFTGKCCTCGQEFLAEKLAIAMAEIDSLTSDIITHPDYSCIDTGDAREIRKKYNMPEKHQSF